TKWPNDPDKVSYKVPTKVGYRAGRKRYTWGFECPEPEYIVHGMDVIECFKLYLDPGFLKDSPRPNHGIVSWNDEDVFWNDEDVQMWFTHFLTALRKHIIKYITTAFPEFGLRDWESNTVEYIFSIPTIWYNK